MRKDEFPIVDMFVKNSINEVLDKIMAEIADAKDDAEIKFGHPLGFDRIATYNKCLQIIDKYRQEG